MTLARAAAPLVALALATSPALAEVPPWLVLLDGGRQVLADELAGVQAAWEAEHAKGRYNQCGYKRAPAQPPLDGLRKAGERARPFLMAALNRAERAGLPEGCFGEAHYLMAVVDLTSGGKDSLSRVAAALTRAFRGLSQVCEGGSWLHGRYDQGGVAEPGYRRQVLARSLELLEAVTEAEEARRVDWRPVRQAALEAAGAEVGSEHPLYARALEQVARQDLADPALVQRGAFLLRRAYSMKVRHLPRGDERLAVLRWDTARTLLGAGAAEVADAMYTEAISDAVVDSVATPASFDRLLVESARYAMAGDRPALILETVRTLDGFGLKDGRAVQQLEMLLGYLRERGHWDQAVEIATHLVKRHAEAEGEASEAAHHARIKLHNVLAAAGKPGEGRKVLRDAWRIRREARAREAAEQPEDESLDSILDGIVGEEVDGEGEGEDEGDADDLGLGLGDGLGDDLETTFEEF